jgi:hypothetical protein
LKAQQQNMALQDAITELEAQIKILQVVNNTFPHLIGF